MTKVLRKKIYKSFAALIVLLTLTLMLAFGGLKAYFSNQRLQDELAKWSDRHKDQVALKVSSLRVELNYDWLPRLAIAGQDLSVSIKNDCELPNVTIDKAILQLSWAGLFAGEFNVNAIKVGKVYADLSAIKECSSFLVAKSESVKPGELKENQAGEIADNEVANDEVANNEPKESLATESKPTSQSPSAAKKIADKSKSSEGKTLVEARQSAKKVPFDVLEVSKLEAKWKGQMWEFNRLKLRPLSHKGSFQLNSQVTLRLPGLTEFEFPRFQLNSKVSRKKVSLLVEGKWKEGDIWIEGDWHQNLGGRTVFQLKQKLKHIPLSPLSEVLHQNDLWKSPLKYQSVWINCETHITGDRKEKSGTLTLDACALTGELGNIDVPHLELSFTNNDFRHFKIEKPFELNVAAVAVRKVMDVFRIDIMGGILKSFGKLEGSATIDVNGHSEFVGQVSDVFVGFSQRGQRAQQKLPLVKGRFALTQDRISGRLEELEIKDGAFQGELSFNFDRRFTEGRVQVGVGELQFSPKIQRLLVRGDIAPLSVFGKFTISENKLTEWEGEIGADSIVRDDFQLRSLRIASTFKGQELKFSILSNEGELSRDSEFFEWLQPMFFGHDFESDQIPLKEFKADLQIANGQWNWNRAQIYLQPQPIILSSEGLIASDGKVNGWINVDFPDYKLVKWDLTGTSESLKINPNAENMRELARQQKDAKKKKK